MPTRSLITSGNVHFWYGKRSPSTGEFYSTSEISSAALTVYDKAGTSLLSVAMTYVANLGGYVYDWTPGTALIGKNIVYAKVVPTTTQAPALVPTEIVPIDVSSFDATFLDLTNGVETNLTPRQWMRLVAAALGGKISGADTTLMKIRDTNDTKDRITAVVDEPGNRLVITLDLS